MTSTVIDTLRFANRLKRAGVQPRQAEAMSRAFNDELADGVATKQDLANAVTELKGQVAAMDAKFEGCFRAVNTRLDAMDEKFAAQGRYVFLVLALVAGLGLYNAVAPHFTAERAVGKQADTVAAAPAAEGPGP